MGNSELTEPEPPGPANPVGPGLPAKPPARLWRFVLAGAMGGLLSGMFGVGGGVIMVPLLIWLGRLDQRRSAAVSLFAILPTALVGAVTYGSRGHVALWVAAIVAGGAWGGVMVGAMILRRIKITVLSWGFVVVLAATAVFMLLFEPSRSAGVLVLDWLTVLELAGLGLCMGLAAGLFGIGGGVIAVPGLMGLFGLGDLVARGTSLLVMVPSAITGSVVNWRGGLVNLKAGLATGLTAAVTSFGGTSLAFLVSPRLGNTLFAGILLISACQLAFRAARRNPAKPSGS